MDNGNVPLSLATYGPFSFLGTPYQIAKLQVLYLKFNLILKISNK